MNQTHTALEYPIVIKQVGDIIVFSCPDLKRTKTLIFPPGTRLTAEFLVKNARKLGEMWIDSHQRLKEITASTHPPPQPSKINMTLEDRGTKPFTPVTLAKILGVCAETIRRDFDSGECQGELTTGGHRKIPFHLGLAYAEKRGYKIDFSLSN